MTENTPSDNTPIIHPEAQYPSYMLGEKGPPVSIFETFTRSAKNGYKQSHSLDTMHLALGPDMRVEELARANTYMNLIFGGDPSPNDALDLAYNHVVRQMAESPVEQDSTVSFQNPLKFVPVGEADKDSILQTFADQRQYYKGALDTDVERFLKSRVTHNLLATTFYNKRRNLSGESLRYNHVSGPSTLLDTDNEAVRNFFPQENLSSRDYAPDGKGGRVPAAYQHIYGPDARMVPITEEARFSSDPIREFTASDLGMYHGNEIDRYQYDMKTNLEDLFFVKTRT